MDKFCSPPSVELQLLQLPSNLPIQTQSHADVRSGVTRNSGPLAPCPNRALPPLSLPSLSFRALSPLYFPFPSPFPLFSLPTPSRPSLTSLSSPRHYCQPFPSPFLPPLHFTATRESGERYSSASGCGRSLAAKRIFVQLSTRGPCTLPTLPTYCYATGRAISVIIIQGYSSPLCRST